MKLRRRLRTLAEAVLRCIWEIQDRPWKAWLNLQTGEGIRFSINDDHTNHDPRPGRTGEKVRYYSPVLQAGYARITYDDQAGAVMNAYVMVEDTLAGYMNTVREYLLQYCPPYTHVIWEERGSRRHLEVTLNNLGRPYQSRVAAFR